MTNEELKESILENILANDLLVLQWSDSDLIANQYVKAIAEQKDLEVAYIEDLADIDTYRSPLDDYCQYLFVLHTDVFNTLCQDYSIYENVVIICKSIDKKVTKLLDGYIVKLDKLEQWQLIDYIGTVCPGIANESANNLYTILQGNPDRINSVCEQISLFDPYEQENILQELIAAKNSDLYFNTAFNLADAVINTLLNREISKNIGIIHDILTHRACCDITPLYVTNILLAKLRNIAIICYGGNFKASDFVNKDGKAMSDKQYYFFKHNYAAIPGTKDAIAKNICNAIKFLSSIDSELKLGNIELDEEYFLDWIIVNLLAK